jgi:DNA-binding MarR family transcriptional regulator
MGKCELEKTHKMGSICACFNLRRATRRVSQAYDQALKPLGLKITQVSLLVAAHVVDRIVLTKLAAVMGMDRTTLSRNLRVLEKRGLVRMEPGEDRREVMVSLTGEGQDILEKAVPLWEETQERVTAILGEERYGVLLKELKDLSKALR